MKSGAIFDLDGTLVYSPGLHIKAWIELFKGYGVILTKNELKEQSGNKNVNFIKKVLQRRNITKLEPQILSDEKDRIVIEVLKVNPAEIFAGVKEFLKLLRKNGIKIAIATSASKVTALVLAKELLKYCDFIEYAEDVEHGKPDPEIFLNSAKGLGLKNTDCVVFEDAESGVKAAKAGGFVCVAKDNGLGQNLKGADLIVKEYEPQKLIKYFT